MQITRQSVAKFALTVAALTSLSLCLARCGGHGEAPPAADQTPAVVLNGPPSVAAPGPVWQQPIETNQPEPARVDPPPPGPDVKVPTLPGAQSTPDQDRGQSPFPPDVSAPPDSTISPDLPGGSPSKGPDTGNVTSAEPLHGSTLGYRHQYQRQLHRDASSPNDEANSSGAPGNNTGGIHTVNTHKTQRDIANPRQSTIDDDFDNLRPGTMAYRAPRPMRVGNWQHVVVRIAGNGAADHPGPDFSSSIPGTNDVINIGVMVGSDVKVRLVGPADEFQINPVGCGADDGRQTLPINSYAEWSWDVRPLTSGNEQLTISYSASSDGANFVNQRSQIYLVDVKANFEFSFERWLGDHWAGTGLSVPILATGFLGIRKIWSKPALTLWTRRVRKPPTKNDQVDKRYTDKESCGYL
jgi:hypothetical protein